MAAVRLVLALAVAAALVACSGPARRPAPPERPPPPALLLLPAWQVSAASSSRLLREYARLTALDLTELAGGRLAAGPLVSRFEAHWLASVVAEGAVAALSPFEAVSASERRGFLARLDLLDGEAPAEVGRAGGPGGATFWRVTVGPTRGAPGETRTYLEREDDADGELVELTAHPALGDAYARTEGLAYFGREQALVLRVVDGGRGTGARREDFAITSPRGQRLGRALAFAARLLDPKTLEIEAGRLEVTPEGLRVRAYKLLSKVEQREPYVLGAAGVAPRDRLVVAPP